MQVARSLNGARDVEELLDQILERSRDVMRCEICSILLPEDQSDTLIIRSTQKGLKSGVRVPIGGSIAGYVFATRESLNIDDVQSDPRHFRPSASKTGVVTRTMLSVALADGERSLGVVQAINPIGRPVFGIEDQEILEIFASLISVTLIRIESHESAIREAELRREFQLAEEIQDSFLAREREDFGDMVIEAFYEPARNVGGDFYFCHELEDGSVLTGIGDVTGKGIPAALDMARGTTMIAAKASLCPTMGLGEWVGRLNDQLCKVMTRGRFIAGTFVHVDRAARRVRAVTAGSCAPKFLRKGSLEWENMPCPPNPPLGIAPGLRFSCTTFPAAVAPSWFVYSDGIPETRNWEGEYFEDVEFPKVLERMARKPTERMLGVLKDAWCAFADHGTYQDDATALVAQATRHYPEPRMEFDCAPDTMAAARNFINHWALHAGFDDTTAGLIVLGCDEIFTNVYRHAYEGSPGHLVCEGQIETSGFNLLLRFHHQGSRGPDDASPPSCPSYEQVGGRGRFVIHEVFESVHHGEGADGCIVELRKRLPGYAASGVAFEG